MLVEVSSTLGDILPVPRSLKVSCIPPARRSSLGPCRNLHIRLDWKKVAEVRPPSPPPGGSVPKTPSHVP